MMKLFTCLIVVLQGSQAKLSWVAFVCFLSHESVCIIWNCRLKEVTANVSAVRARKSLEFHLSTIKLFERVKKWVPFKSLLPFYNNFNVFETALSSSTERTKW